VNHGIFARKGIVFFLQICYNPIQKKDSWRLDDMGYQTIQIDSQTWRIDEDQVRFFLLTGTERALLIDSGMAVKNAKEIAESLTDLPVSLLNTHGDIDHIGSNQEFESVYMNPAECANYCRYARITPVWDGDIIDLGDRPIEIITIPGHTPGSIALLDKKYRVLFGGDSIQDGSIFMFGPARDIFAYPHSLRKLSRYDALFDTIYPSHGSFPVLPQMIPELIKGTGRLLQGEFTPENASFHGIPVKAYHIGPATLLCDASFPNAG